MILSTIDLSAQSIPEEVALELERMMRDGGEFDCQIGNVRFKACVDRGVMIKKFVPMSGIGFEFTMRAGRFRVDSTPLEHPPIRVIENKTETMGWQVQSSCVGTCTRTVWLIGFKGHASIPDLIVALDGELLPYKLRVIDARPAVEIGEMITEKLVLKFGW